MPSLVLQLPVRRVPSHGPGKSRGNATAAGRRRRAGLRSPKVRAAFEIRIWVGNRGARTVLRVTCSGTGILVGTGSAKVIASRDTPARNYVPVPRLVLGGKHNKDMLPPFRLDHPSSRSLLKDISIPSTEWPSLPVLTNPVEVPGGFADTKCDFKWEDDLYQSQSSCSVWSVDTQESAHLSTSEVRT